MCIRQFRDLLYSPIKRPERERERERERMIIFSVLCIIIINIISRTRQINIILFCQVAAPLTKIDRIKLNHFNEI